MGIARLRAVILALYALERLMERARAAPIAPDDATKALLACLYSDGGGCVDPYLDFARALEGCDAAAVGLTVASIHRGCGLTVAWNGILNDLGIDGSIALTEVLAEVRQGHFTQEAAICNRYRMEADAETMRARYGVYGDGGRLREPELFPRREAAVIVNDRGPAGEWRRTMELMAWGVIRVLPGKRGGPIERPVANVRNLESPFWRGMLLRAENRCLVPFTAFSEYGQVRGADGKLPLHWFTVPSQPISSFAGIWRGTERGNEFAFLTCEPNALVAPIHPKAMPVILHPEDEERWLRGEWWEIKDLVAPFPSQLMAMD